MSISKNCSQSIDFTCNFNGISNYSWWNDRNGKKIEYWHGALNEKAKGCQCAQTASCERLNKQNKTKSRKFDFK